MFNPYETELLEYLLNHNSASREDIEHAFTDRYMYSSALDDLVSLGVVKWDFDLYDGRYIIADNWQSYLKRSFRLRDNLAQLDAEKAAKKEIENVKSERFKLIYSLVISFVIILVVLSFSLLRKGLPLFSVNSLTLLAFVAGASFLVVLPAFLILTSFPIMFNYSPEAAPALPATIIGSTSLALALALALFLISPDYNSSTLAQSVDDRSYILFLDGDDTVHYDPFCREATYSGNPYGSIFYSLDNLDEDIRDFDSCSACNWVFYEYENEMFHLSPDCPNIPHGIKTYELLITDCLTERDPNPCPFCF